MKAQHPSQSSSLFAGYSSNASIGNVANGDNHGAFSRSLPLGTIWQQLRTTFGSLGERLTTFATGSSDPVVRQKRDRQGQVYYSIYDPISRCHTTCASEAEVRSWLEQRYYL